MEPVLELEGIVKRFPGVVANDHIDFSLRPGEIHAILGENGAGKSTLMNVLYGLLAPDEGIVRLDGQPVRFSGPADAIQHGIGMVHQHFMLIPVMTVVENVMLGQEKTRLGLLTPREAAEELQEIAGRYGLKVDSWARVEELSVGEQQRVEILKVLSRQARILILDEPTAVLAPQEVEELFEVLRRLASAGHSLIFITHKLREAVTLADRITVLRGGKVVGTVLPQETDEEQLAAMMVGRDVQLTVDKTPAQPKEVVLSVRDLWVGGQHDVPAVRGVSFDVRAGEIVGVAGVQGNGQTELMEALAGLRPVLSGVIQISGVQAVGLRPRQITELGVAYIPEDRQEDGLILSFPVEDNLVLNSYYKPPLSHYGWLDRTAIRQRAERLIKDFDIRPTDPQVRALSLSGGNQQKIIAARELSRPLRLLLANQPTRGLDVGSIEYLHRRIVQARDSGVAVLVVSTELDEILALCDRVVVMYQGQIVNVHAAGEVSRQRIGLMMAGATA